MVHRLLNRAANIYGFTVILQVLNHLYGLITGGSSLWLLTQLLDFFITLLQHSTASLAAHVLGNTLYGVSILNLMLHKQ